MVCKKRLTWLGIACLTTILGFVYYTEITFTMICAFPSQTPVQTHIQTYPQQPNHIMDFSEETIPTTFLPSGKCSIAGISSNSFDELAQLGYHTSLPVIIGYTIMVHNTPGQFHRMFSRVYQPYHFFVINIDSKANQQTKSKIIEAIKLVVGGHDNVEILFNQVCYATIDMVTVELEMIYRLLVRDPHIDFIINLSASDYPVRTENELQEFLRYRRGYSFVSVVDPEKDRVDYRLGKVWIKDDMECLMHKVPQDIEKQRKIFYDENFQTAGICFGSQWRIISREFAAYTVLNMPQHIAKFLSFLSTSLTADEFFFATVAGNSDTYFQQRLVKDNLHYIEWNQTCANESPCLLEERMWPAIQQSKRFWARKFQFKLATSINLMNIIDEHLGFPKYFLPSSIDED